LLELETEQSNIKLDRRAYSQAYVISDKSLYSRWNKPALRAHVRRS